jgi:hypothetical protein
MKQLLFVLIIIGNILYQSFWAYSVSTQEADIKSIPSNYSFLMFPKENAEIFRTAALKDGDVVASLNRSVTVEYSEMEQKVVRVVLDGDKEGFVSIASLSFLPLADDKLLLNDWQAKLQAQGYTSGGWDVKELGNGNREITLRLADDKHARSNTYIYEVGGNKLIKISPIKGDSGVLWAVVMFRILFVSAIVWLIFRIIKVKS